MAFRPRFRFPSGHRSDNNLAHLGEVAYIKELMIGEVNKTRYGITVSIWVLDRIGNLSRVIY